jgi:hypothetical protein
MAIEADLLEMLESTVQVTARPAPRRDGSRPTGGTPVPIQCHIETRRRLVRNQAGEEVTSEGRALCDDAYPWMNETCSIVLPDGTTPPIVAVVTSYGLNLDTGVNGPYQTVINYGA